MRQTLLDTKHDLVEDCEFQMNMVDSVELCEVSDKICLEAIFFLLEDFHPEYREFQTFQLPKAIEHAKRGPSVQRLQLGMMMGAVGTTGNRSPPLCLSASLSSTRLILGSPEPPKWPNRNGRKHTLKPWCG